MFRRSAIPIVVFALLPLVVACSAPDPGARGPVGGVAGDAGGAASGGGDMRGGGGDIGGGGGGGGADHACESDEDCGPSDVCTQVVCTADHACARILGPPGCEVDCSARDTECVESHPMYGHCVHEVLVGKACGVDGADVCWPEGTCAPALCRTDADCGSETACATPVCDGVACQLVPKNEGQALPNQTPGDCQVLVCHDGAVVSQADPGDVPPDDGNICTEELCVDGVPTTRNVQWGTLYCDPPYMCDGEGHCSYMPG